jgi:hypothetical protein
VRIGGAVSVALAGVALLGASPMAGTTGVSIDVGHIDVTEELAPGSEYRLPAFGVRNPGTESTTYAIVVSPVEDATGLQPPSSWFEFSPSELTLAAAQSRPVTTTLEIPPGAEPGDYVALIGPQIVPRGSGGAQVGAGAAARLTFTVRPSSWLDGALRWLLRFLADHPWIWIGLLLLAALLAIRVLRRRFSVQVTRRS